MNAAMQLFQFLKEVRLELTRIEWPKMDAFVGSTIVVFFLIFVSSIFLGGVDYIVKEWVLKGILARFF